MERLTNRKTRLAKGGPEPSMLDVVHKLADYEDLEEQGKLKKLPCKIGDTIYVIPSKANYGLNIVNRHKENNRVYEQIVDHIRFYRSGYLLSTCEGQACVVEESYKETWFLIKDEAEIALEKLKDVWKELEGMQNTWVTDRKSQKCCHCPHKNILVHAMIRVFTGQARLRLIIQ